MSYWPLIPLFAGLLLLAGCMLYARSKRSSDGQPFQGRTAVAVVTVISIGLLLCALIRTLTATPSWKQSLGSVSVPPVKLLPCAKGSTA